MGDNTDSRASENIDAQLLVRFLNGDMQARDTFFRQHRKNVIRIAKRVASDLASCDLVDDVEMEFWKLLLYKKAKYYDPAADVDVWAQLTLLIRTAADNVRSQNPLPFQPKSLKRTVAGKADSKRKKEASHSLERNSAYEEDREKLSEVSYEEAFETLSTTPFVRGVYLDSDFQQAENKMEAQVILTSAQRNAPHFVSHAINLIYAEGIVFTKAAELAGVKPWTLRRHLRRWTRAEKIKQ